MNGIDINSLDTVILAYCGKSERIQIQSCGRVLRLTKTGNRAYIIDFNDFKDPVLNYQFKLRLKRYKELIGVNSSDIYFCMSRDKLEEVFNKYETN